MRHAVELNQGDYRETDTERQRERKWSTNRGEAWSPIEHQLSNRV
jgi:hypothetical protein